MKLLVSVRCGAEVTQALEGGADIIDAKEPARGSLGAVGAEVLGEIAAALPAGVPLSVALGDLSSSTEVEGAVAALGVQAARTAYLKVGFAGLAEERRIRQAIAALVASASMLAGRPRVIAVAYADHDQAATLSPSMMAILAAEAGADGVLLDTWTKDGRDLFAWMPLSSLKEWIADVRGLGLTAAVAGSIRAESIPTVLRAQPDIVGVRGAACEGGRTGVVSVSRVRSVRAAFDARPTLVSTSI